MSDTTGARILAVEDSDNIRRLIAYNLQRAGYEVLQAANGKEAVRILQKTVPDLILLDIRMPEMNGFEFAEAIRADRRMEAMPIIALSSVVSPAAIERGRQAGFHDYVAKFDRPGLIAALKEQTADVKQAA